MTEKKKGRRMFMRPTGEKAGLPGHPSAHEREVWESAREAQGDTRPLAEDGESREAGPPADLLPPPDPGERGDDGSVTIPGGLPALPESSSTSYPAVPPPPTGKMMRSMSGVAARPGIPGPAPAAFGSPIGMPTLPPRPASDFSSLPVPPAEYPEPAGRQGPPSFEPGRTFGQG